MRLTSRRILCHARVAAGFLLLGLVLNATISVVIALCWHSLPHRIEFYSPPPHTSLLSRITVLGFDRTSLVPLAPPFADKLDRVDLRPQPKWRTLQLQWRRPHTHHVDAAGFPFKAFYCEWTAMTHPFEGVESAERWGLQGGIALAPVDPAMVRVVDNWRAIPITPIARGLLWNSLLYAIGSAMIFYLHRLVHGYVSYKRRRRGRCEYCGYPTAEGSPLSECPECGHPPAGMNLRRKHDRRP